MIRVCARIALYAPFQYEIRSLHLHTHSILPNGLLHFKLVLIAGACFNNEQFLSILFISLSTFISLERPMRVHRLLYSHPHIIIFVITKNSNDKKRKMDRNGMDVWMRVWEITMGSVAFAFRWSRPLRSCGGGDQAMNINYKLYVRGKAVRICASAHKCKLDAQSIRSQKMSLQPVISVEWAQNWWIETNCERDNGRPWAAVTWWKATFIDESKNMTQNDRLVHGISCFELCNNHEFRRDWLCGHSVLLPCGSQWF